MYVINFIRGFFMALADSVPGVSGGTIAFILGFYDKFITSINNLFSGSRDERIEAFKFLAKIGIGWTVGLVLSILFISSIFEEHIYQISSVFLGLIIVAIPYIIIEEKDTLKDKYSNIVYTILGLAIVVLITYYNPLNSNGGVDGSISSLSFTVILLVLLAGIVAISAMVLPGISGSTILLIMGLYGTIITSIKEVLHLNLEFFPIVFIFGLGVLLGIFLTIKSVKYVLDHHRSRTIYTITGLMIGSIFAVLMGPKSLEVPQPAMDIQSFSFLYFLLGGGIIVGLQYLRKKLEKNVD